MYGILITIKQGIRTEYLSFFQHNPITKRKSRNLYLFGGIAASMGLALFLVFIPQFYDIFHVCTNITFLKIFVTNFYKGACSSLSVLVSTYWVLCICLHMRRSAKTNYKKVLFRSHPAGRGRANVGATDSQSTHYYYTLIPWNFFSLLFFTNTYTHSH